MKSDRLLPLTSSVSIFVLMAQKEAPCVADQMTRVPSGSAITKVTIIQQRNHGGPNRTCEDVGIYFRSCVSLVFRDGGHLELWVDVHHCSQV